MVLLVHYKSDGIIGTLKSSEKLLRIIVIFVIIILLRTVIGIVNCLAPYLILSYLILNSTSAFYSMYLL